jgi:uncharacterized membrane protein YccC
VCFLSRRSTTTIVMCGLCVLGAFILDLITPLGVPVWLLYGVPFLFLNEYTPRYHVHALAGVCTILILVGYLLSFGTQPEPIMERIGATIIVWSITIVLFRRKQRA